MTDEPEDEERADADEAPIISLSHVSKRFDTGKKRKKGESEPPLAVDDVSLDIQAGQIQGVIGYSGAGKSTLVRLINALERPTSGIVTVLGQDITGLNDRQLRPIRQKIGMVFQQFNLFQSKTVYGNIAYPLERDRWRNDYIQARVDELLDFVGLSAHRDKYPSQLSGGQKQRVGIARALATRPRILLADEATSALDPETTRDVLDLLKRVNTELGVTIVLITHQMDVVKRIADRVLVMSHGRAVEENATFPLFAAPQSPVTAHFIATVTNDVPSRATVDELHRHYAGRLITVELREAAPEYGIEPSGQTISSLIASSDVTSSLLDGGVDYVDGHALGAITYEFTGSDAALATFVGKLRETSDIVDFGTRESPADYEQAVRASIFANRLDDPLAGGEDTNGARKDTPGEIDEGALSAQSVARE